MKIKYSGKYQCGSCEKYFDKLDKGNCPHCHSGNWVKGCIDEPEPIHAESGRILRARLKLAKGIKTKKLLPESKSKPCCGAPLGMINPNPCLCNNYKKAHAPTVKTYKGTLGVGVGGDESQTQLIDSDGWHVAYIELSPHREIAEFIVRACNSHEELLEALKIASEWVIPHSIEKKRPSDLNTVKHAQKIINEAIAKAEGN